MKFNLIRTRRGKLRRNILRELGNQSPNIETILNYVDEYENNNLQTITKLKRKRDLVAKKINGALKQTIGAHGPITKQLIGSASKRILGATMVEPERNEGFFKKLIKKLK